MNKHEVSLEIAKIITNMEDGEVSSIARLAHKVHGEACDEDMFTLMNLVIYECAKEGIFLDYSEHDGKDEGLPYNLTFVVRRTKEAGAPIGDAYLCALHHPHVNSEICPDITPEEYTVDRALVYFNGKLEDAKKKYYKNDDGSGFAIDCVQIDERNCVIALIDGAYRYPIDAYLGEYGEPICSSNWFAEEFERWDFIVSKDPIDIVEAMKGYRQAADGEFVWIENEVA